MTNFGREELLPLSRLSPLFTAITRESRRLDRAVSAARGRSPADGGGGGSRSAESRFELLIIRPASTSDVSTRGGRGFEEDVVVVVVVFVVQSSLANGNCGENTCTAREVTTTHGGFPLESVGRSLYLSLTSRSVYTVVG